MHSNNKKLPVTFADNSLFLLLLFSTCLSMRTEYLPFDDNVFMHFFTVASGQDCSEKQRFKKKLVVSTHQ